ncbi:MAG: pilus assembly protein PilM [Lachnospiraceae bacterium]|nr:pilus assembly protein PilM [Lachnospiraceae bacterium]
MAEKVLSIEIGMHTTRICMTDYKVKNPKVYAHAKFPTPKGSIIDGEIQVTEELVDTIKSTLSANKMNCKQVVFTVASSKIANREIVIPKAKPKQIASLIANNASDYFPIDLSQYELGHVILGTVQENSIEKYKALVLAFPLSLLESYREMAHAIGKQIAAIDYSGHSIYQMVKNECDEGVQMVVKIDEESSIVTILKEKTIVLQRNVAYGINDALATIMETPAFMAPTYEEAVDLSTRKTCTKLSISAKQMIEAEEEEEDAMLLAGKQAVANSLKMIINGIGRIMDYHASRNNGEGVEQIYITGMGANFSGLSKLLTNELGVKTKGLVHLEGFNIEKAFKDGLFGEYIACIGAAVAPLGLVSDKKDKDNKAKKAGNDYTGASVLLLIGGTLIGIALVAVSYMNYMQAEQEYNNNIRRMNELVDIRGLHANYLVTEDAYGQIQKLYAVTENHNENMLQFISELEEKMPANIRVKTFSAMLDNVTMNIEVDTKEEMAVALQELRHMKSVETVTVMGVSDDVDENDNRVVTFTVSCIYKTMEQMALEEALLKEGN